MAVDFERDPWADDDQTPDCCVADPWAEDDADAVVDQYLEQARRNSSLPIEDQSAANQESAAELRAEARRLGMLAFASVAGPFGVHLARPLVRLGDCGAEHCRMQVVTGPHVGVDYRRPIFGGPAWHAELGEEDLAIARRAPHVMDSI